MIQIPVKTNPDVKAVFNNYPDGIREKLLNLRTIIIETASTTDGINHLEETLKWGEPSYLVKYGSTIRIDWKPKHPDRYAIYFKCTSALVPAFRTVYKGRLTFEGNRAILFKMEDTLPVLELQNCIRAALRYHKVKHLPLLGMQSLQF
jgi:hypothetical protein